MKERIIATLHALRRHKTRGDLHAYWRKPWDRDNQPQDYASATGHLRSDFLVSLVHQYATPDSAILEIGCNVGRNLHYLFTAGFHNLAGIEISEPAVSLLRQTYSEMASCTNIINATVEDAIVKLTDAAYSIVFTMAVLEHIHPDSAFIFADMVRVTGNYLITIEDESGVSWRHFPRNYQKVFEPLGMSQIQATESPADLGANFVARVFKKNAAPVVDQASENRPQGGER